MYIAITSLADYADTYIQKTKKLYVDTRTQRNISKLNEDLTEVHSIMTKNIQDVLGQGERLDSKIASSSHLVMTASCKGTENFQQEMPPLKKNFWLYQ